MPELFHRFQSIQQLPQGSYQAGQSGAQDPAMRYFHQFVRLAPAKADRHALALAPNRQSRHPPIALMRHLIQPLGLGQLIDAMTGKQLGQGAGLERALAGHRHVLQRATATIDAVGTERLLSLGRGRQHLEQAGALVLAVLHLQSYPNPLSLERAGHKQRLVPIPGQTHTMSVQLDNGHLQRRLCLGFGLVFLEELNHKTWSPRTGYVIISVC